MCDTITPLTLSTRHVPDVSATRPSLARRRAHFVEPRESDRVGEAERIEVESVNAWTKLQRAVVEAAEAATRRVIFEHRLPASMSEEGAGGLVKSEVRCEELRKWYSEAHGFRVARECGAFDEQRAAAAAEAAAVSEAWSNALTQWKVISRRTLLEHHRSAAKLFRRTAHDATQRLARVGDAHRALVREVSRDDVAQKDCLSLNNST